MLSLWIGLVAGVIITYRGWRQYHQAREKRSLWELAGGLLIAGGSLYGLLPSP